MPKFTVSVQYRSVRTINIQAKDKDEAIEKASAWVAADVDEVIACRIEPNAEDAQAKAAASARGWVEGGGYVYHRDHFGSWKEAVSWSGEEGHEDHPLYDSWRECCEGEGIDMAAEGA